jgi:hypothetical protein
MSLADVDEIDILEFQQWMLYDKVEPFGDRANFIQAGAVAAAVINTSTRSKETDKYYTPSDIFQMLREQQAPPKPQTAEEQLQMMLMIQKVQNANVGADG